MWLTFKSIVITMGIGVLLITVLWLSYILVPIVLLILIYGGIRSYLEYQKENPTQ